LAHHPNGNTREGFPAAGSQKEFFSIDGRNRGSHVQPVVFKNSKSSRVLLLGMRKGTDCAEGRKCGLYSIS